MQFLLCIFMYLCATGNVCATACCVWYLGLSWSLSMCTWVWVGAVPVSSNCAVNQGVGV